MDRSDTPQKPMTVEEMRAQIDNRRERGFCVSMSDVDALIAAARAEGAREQREKDAAFVEQMWAAWVARSEAGHGYEMSGEQLATAIRKGSERVMASLPPDDERALETINLHLRHECDPDWSDDVRNALAHLRKRLEDFSIRLGCGHTMADWEFEDELSGFGHCSICREKP